MCLNEAICLSADIIIILSNVTCSRHDKDEILLICLTLHNEYSFTLLFTKPVMGLLIIA